MCSSDLEVMDARELRQILTQAGVAVAGADGQGVSHAPPPLVPSWPDLPNAPAGVTAEPGCSGSDPAGKV